MSPSEEGEMPNDNETRVVVRIEKLGDRSDNSDDDEVFVGSATPSSTDNEPEIEKPESSRVSPPKPNLPRDVREESPVFYLDPVDWVRVEGSSPIPVTLPVVAQEPVLIPEVIISPTHRNSSQLHNTISCENQINSKLLLSPSHVSGCICGGRQHRSYESTPFDDVRLSPTTYEDDTKKRLRSKSYSSAHMSALPANMAYYDDRHVFRTTSSGSYLTSHSLRRERMSTTESMLGRMSPTESLLGRNRRRKVAIPILCARAAAMVGLNHFNRLKFF
jgi:hypothetical protein